jgi:alkaline phosphatase D
VITTYHDAVARLSRREWLNAAWALGAAAVLHPIISTRVHAQAPAFKVNPFTLGVASGDPLSDAVVIWTRLAPDPLAGGGMPMTAVDVTWEEARDERFQTVVRNGTAVARPELGHSVHVDVTGLEPGREYWYRFRAGGEASDTGRTKTAPAQGMRVDRLRFAVCGCAHYEFGYYTAYRGVADEHFDFAIHTGDYIYEGRSNPRAVRHHHGDECYSLDDYRARYAQYKLDPDLRAVHLSTPFIVIADDHEVMNNYAGDHDARGTPTEVFRLRRAAAYQAYYEHMPLRAAAIPDGSHMRMYRRLQFGSLVDLHMLDTRQWRTDQACGDGYRTGCREAEARDRTMMGAEQEAWLFRNLATRRGQWTVIGQQVPTFALDRRAIDANGRFSMDRWDGYVHARQRLYQRLHETRAANPIVLSGDVHQHYAAELKMGPAHSIPVGVELTNTSISSGGDGADVSAEWPRIQSDNPQVKVHSSRRGYIACTVTPAQLHADFRVVERISLPDQPLRTAATVVVDAGRSAANLA